MFVAEIYTWVKNNSFTSQIRLYPVAIRVSQRMAEQRFWTMKSVALQQQVNQLLLIYSLNILVPVTNC